VLLRFRFSNFRSFRDEQELSLIAGPFTDLPDVVRHPAGIKEGVLPGAAIYGANASGKTNVIQAMGFMASAVSLSHRAWRPDGPIPREPFVANESTLEPSEIEADFLLAGVRHRYGFRIDSEAVLEEWLYVYPKGKKQTWFHRKRGNPIVFGNKMPGENRTIENLTRHNSLFLSAAAQNAHEALLPIFTWLSGLLSVLGDRSEYREHTARLCSELDYKNEIARLVSVADLGIAEMSVEECKLPDKTKEHLEALVTTLNLPKAATLLETKQAIRFLHRLGSSTVPFDMDQESDGTLAYLALLGPAVEAIKKGTPLLIDELDASLHPLLATQLIRLFNSPSSNPKGAQLIFNTHDTNLLSSGVLRRDQIWFTEKGNDATSHLYPLSDFKPRRQENLQNGYLQGRYGAIPFINPDAFLLRFEADRVEA
jgi:predicted ATP-dependent endonuclease of OLD family